MFSHKQKARALVALVCLGASASAYAHGGTYGHGCAGEVPPDSREPSDPPPPTDPRPPPPADPRDERAPFVSADDERLARRASVVDHWWFLRRDALAPVQVGVTDKARSETLDRLAAWLPHAGKHEHAAAAAALVLARSGRAEVSGPLRGLAGPDESGGTTAALRRDTAILALGELPDPEGTHLPVLLNGLAADSTTATFAAIAVALHADRNGTDAEASATLVRTFADSTVDHATRHACAIALGWAADSRGLADLTTMLLTGRTHRTAAVRMDETCLSVLLVGASRAASRLENRRHAERVLAFAQRTLSYPPTSPTMRRAAIAAISTLGPTYGAQGAFGVQSVLSDTACDVTNEDATRCSAALAIADVTRAHATPETRRHGADLLIWMLPSAATRESELARSALMALGTIGALDAASSAGVASQEVTDALRGALTVGQPMERRAAAAFALGLCGDGAMFPEVLALLRNPSTSGKSRELVVTALGLLGDPAAVDPLRKALHPLESHAVRRASARALGRLGATDPARLVLAQLPARATVGEADPRTAAAALLGQLRDPDQLGFLTHLATAPEGVADDGARHAAVRAIGRILAPTTPGALERLLRPIDRQLDTPGLRGVLRWGR